MTYKSEFKIGEKVFHITDPEQQEMLVVGVVFRDTGKQIECRTTLKEIIEFFEYELAHEIDTVKKINSGGAE